MPKLIQEREQPKTQHNLTQNRPSQSQSHIPTLMRTHKNTHTRAPNVKTHNNGHHTLTHTPHTPYSQVQVPIPQSPPRPRRWSPSLQGGDRQTAPAPAQTSAGNARTRATPAQTLIPRPDPSPQQPPSGEGALYKRGAYLFQTSLPPRAATE
ncbi:hypothetical protein ATANTOWER_022990 [Ataeniobius toweri]|uniref:Uncharacterized protein n=1 Tax=Ataeniobius toweri TaxID=208326 RepID=A0ABU7BUB2_9TELE|nr:hypothetical protein [Ataeniobius toweri]